MLERILLYFAKYPIDFMAYASSILPVFAGLFRFKYLDNSNKYILFFFVWFFLKETYSLYLAFTTPSNLFLQNVEPIFESIFCGLIFYFCLNKPLERKLAIAGTIICTLLLIYFYRSDEVSAASLITFRVFAIILVLLYFNRLLTDMQVLSITRHTLFWFSSGLLIYSAGTFFIVLFSEYWYQNINKVPADVFDRYWNSSQILFIAFSILSAIGLWLSKYDQRVP